MDAAELDPRAIRRAFDRAAGTYDAHAVLQREVATRLLERLALVRVSPRVVLDLGAGTGYCARQLERRRIGRELVLCDLSHAMLREAKKRAKRWFSRQRPVCGDANALPLADGSVDLIVSSLTLQWCENLDRVFEECRRVLAPSGLLLFSSLGPDTLFELRDAWAQVDAEPHVNRFIDMHDVGDGLIRAGFENPVLEREDLVLTYADVTSLMRDLKGIGASNNHASRTRHLRNPRQIKHLAAAYERYRRDGMLPATYEVVYGHAWLPVDSLNPQNEEAGVATFPLSRLRRRDGLLPHRD